MQAPINQYGDQLILAGEGHGADIASQRADDLDNKAISFARDLTLAGTAVKALDVGAGRGAQAQRLLKAGASDVVACDLFDFSQDFHELTKDVPGRALFLRADLREAAFARDIADSCKINEFDLICFQRTIHYFKHAQARVILAEIIALLKQGGRLYISASGLGSELGVGYPDATKPVAARFCELAPPMREKHGIHGSVCLYAEDDLTRLCQEAGLVVLEAQESSFGNIKVIAEKK